LAAGRFSFAHAGQLMYNDRLLPEWRLRNWADPAEVAAIGQEMKRVQEGMDADEYSHLQYLYDHGPTSNHALTISVASATARGLQAAFSVTAGDADHQGSTVEGLTFLFDYGDGQTGPSTTHEYARSGRYLVSCSATDEHGVSQTDWIFLTVGGPACDGGGREKTNTKNSPFADWTDGQRYGIIRGKGNACSSCRQVDA
jgi:hypothetical protein